QTLRCARQAGLDDAQLRLVLGGQLARLLDGRDPADAGPGRAGVEPERIAVDALLDRVATFLVAAFAQIVRGAGSGEEMLSLARLACEVPGDAPQAAHARLVLELLDAGERLAGAPAPGSVIPAGLHLMVLALNVCRTPDVPVPSQLLV
ncbi:MAG TPA: hypothetical protein VFV85_07490, partial [Conexibacter sp.]|nr:hypothetical protein [Conexibacter sp.]